MKTVIIDRFDGGISDDPRTQANGVYQFVTNFDATTYPHKLVPVRSEETDTTTFQDYRIGSVVYMYPPNQNQAIFALGRTDTTNNYVQIFEKSTIAGDFAKSTTAAGTVGTVAPHTLVAYKNNLYGIKRASAGLATLFKYDANTNTLTEAFGILSGTYETLNVPVPQPFHHKKSDTLFVAAEKTVSSLNNTTFTESALVIPSDHWITCFAEYGSYLAIAARPKADGGRSFVYLWDMVSPDITESIDFGDGALMAIENVDGILVGVSTTQPLAVDGSASIFSVKPKIAIRAYQGGSAQIIREITSESSTAKVYNFKQVKDGVFYFAAKLMTGGVAYHGLMTVFRNKGGALSVGIAHDLTDALNTGADFESITGFSFIGDYLWLGYYNNGSDGVYHLVRTSTSATYVNGSTLITQKYTGGDTRRKKQLLGVWVNTEPLPSGGAVLLQYKKDEESSYTQIFTESTTNTVTHESINIESTGGSLPTFNEIQFFIKSTGGAVITGYGFNYEELAGLTN